MAHLRGGPAFARIFLLLADLLPGRRSGGGEFTLRVIINQEAALTPKTGVGHYAAQLLSSLRKQAGPDRVIGYTRSPWLGACRSVLSRLRPRPQKGYEGQVAGPTASASSLARFQGWVQKCLRQRGKAFLAHLEQGPFFGKKYDLYHEPNYIPFPSDCPTLTTLHDLSVLLYPNWHPAARVAAYDLHFSRTLTQSIGFVTGSDFTRRQVIRELGIAPERVTRIYYGVRPGLEPMLTWEVPGALRKLDLPPQYLLYVGTIEPRKNVLRLLQAYCALPANLRERWPLLLAGTWGWDFQTVAAYYRSEARHRGVRHLGYVKDGDLPVLYNGARALVYPSLYEGFGLPPLEMMACGGAVLASTAEALVETVGPHAHLTHPEDIDGWRSALVRVLTDDDWWRSLRQGVTEFARPFTWERCAAETLALYRSLCGVTTSSALPVARAA
jgi:glycosyltransferase involved in cell wall biosynthesis